MKMLKVLFLFIMLLCLSFSACGGDSDTLDNEIEKEREYWDFMGDEFVLTSHWSNFYYPDMITDYGLDGEAKRLKIKNTEELLDCKITIEHAEDYSSAFMARFATGDSGTDIFDGFTYLLYKMYKAGQITAYEDISTIDLENEALWSTKNFRKPVYWDSQTYGVWYAQWPYMPEYYGALMYNNELLKYFGATNPAELYEQKEWTLDNFEKMLQQCNEKPAAGGSGIYAMSVYNNELEQLPITGIFANGGGVVKEANGNYYFGYNDPEALEVFEWCAKIYAQDNLIKVDGWYPTLFPTKQATFTLTCSWVGVVNQDWAPLLNLTDTAWVHFPVGSYGENGKTFGGYVSDNLRFLSVPVDAETEDVGYLMSVLFTELETYPMSEHIESLKKYYFHHDYGFDLYMEAVNNANYVYSNILEKNKAKFVSTLNSIVKSKTGISEGIGSIYDMINTEIGIEMNNN